MTQNTSHLTSENQRFLDAEGIERSTLSSVTSEQIVLASILLEPQLLDNVVDVLPVSAFVEPSNNAIYQIFLALSQDKQEITLSTVASRNELHRHGVDQSYLVDLFQFSPTAKDFYHHVDILNDLHIRRSLIDTSRSLAVAANDLRSDTEEIITNFHRSIDNNYRVQTSFAEPLFSDEDIEKVKQLQIFPTRFPTLNKFCMPTAGQVFIVGAGTNVGKTALSLALGFDWALNGHKVLYFSCEMTRESLAFRGYSFLRIATKGELHRAFRNTDADEQLAEILKKKIKSKSALIDILRQNMRVYSHGFPTINDIKREVRNNNYPDIVIVDYVQIMQSVKDQAAYKEMSDRILGLKEIAMNPRHRCLVLTMSQLTTQTNKDGVVVNTAAREGRDIENHADVFLELSKKSNAKSEDGVYKTIEELTLEVRKSRDGPKGRTTLTFEGDYQSFEEGPQEEYFRKYPNSRPLSEREQIKRKH